MDDSKSLSGNHSVPFSNKPDHAFNDMTAFSPPSDSWIIRYPENRRDSRAGKKDDSRKPPMPAVQMEENYCQNYIEGKEIPVRSTKSLGTDDHFKSAVCSKNLLKVCEKLLVNNEFVRNSKDDSADDSVEELFDRKRMDLYRKKVNRRGSQSLPASPKMERKMLQESTSTQVSHNPYFTVSKPPERTESNISFLTSMFGFTAKSPAEATSSLTQKYQHDEATNVSVDTKLKMDGDDLPKRKITPKPNEYREMNLFSPTSM